MVTLDDVMRIAFDRAEYLTSHGDDDPELEDMANQLDMLAKRKAP